MEHITYIPRGVCARKIELDIEDGRIVTAHVVGGCAGNSQGVAALLSGMTVEDAVTRLKGIRCGFKSTSCPDQIAQALLSTKEKQD